MSEGRFLNNIFIFYSEIVLESDWTTLIDSPVGNIINENISIHTSTII